MAAPASPYCTSAQVAVLVPQLVRNAADFGNDTQPTKAIVTAFIGWKASEINMRFASVGYIVPLQAISGEDWPNDQTNVLALMNAMAVAGMIVGPVIKPAPAMGRDGGIKDNGFIAAYKDFLALIKQNGSGFRANYHVGSQAEQFCRYPAGPTTDYLEGYLDPTRFQTTGEYTSMIQAIRSDYSISIGNLAWDHLKAARDSLLA